MCQPKMKKLVLLLLLRDPWAESTSSYGSQRSNEFATAFEDYNNNNNNNNQSTWYFI